MAKGCNLGGQGITPQTSRLPSEELGGLAAAVFFLWLGVLEGPGFPAAVFLSMSLTSPLESHAEISKDHLVPSGRVSRPPFFPRPVFQSTAGDDIPYFPRFSFFCRMSFFFLADGVLKISRKSQQITI